MEPFTAATTPTVTPLPLEESPTQLDLTLGAPIPREAQAFSAYSALHEQKKAGQPLDPIAVKEWTTYRDTAKAYNRPLFPSKTAPIQRENAKQIDNLLSGLDTVPTLLPEPQAKAMQAHLQAFPEADRPNAAARAVNYSLLQQATGKPIRPDTYDSFRDTYAKQILKLDKTDDLSVYTELKRRNDLKKDADKELAADFEHLASDALAGKPIDIAAHQKKYTEYFGEDLGHAAALELRQRTRQTRTLGKSIKPLAEELRAFILHDGGREDLITDPAQLDRAKTTNAELMGNKLKNLSPIQKDAIRIYLGETLQALGQDPEGTAERAGEAFNRGIENQLGGGIASFLARASQVPGNIVNTIAGNDRNTERTAELDNFLTSFAFLKDKTNKIGTLANPSESWASASVIAAAEQLPYMIAASAGGAGLVATGMSMAGQSYESARLRNPEGNDSTQFIAATLSGASQAVIERAAVKVTGRALGALPIFKSTFGAKFGTEGFLKLARIQSPLLRAAAGGAIGAAAVGATEYAEEIAQDSVDRLLQDIVSIPTGVTDDNGQSSTLYRNLANTVASWDPFSEKGAKMLLSLMPFILIGAGGGSFSSFQNGVQLQRNAAEMRTLGVPEPIIQEIVSTPDVKRADTLLKQAVQTELIENDKANAEQHASALAEYIDTVTTAWRSQGIEIIEPQFDDEGNVTAHTLALPTGPKQFATEEEAMQALIDYNREQGEMLLDEGLEAITAETIDHFFAPGQRAAEGDFTARERDFEGTFANLLENKLASAAQLKDRLAAYAMQEGVTLADASKMASAGTLKIKARNFAEQVNRGSWRYVVELFKGADPVNAIEDFAEAYWKAAINEGILQPERAISWIRQMEDATGNDYLPADFTWTPQTDNIALWEALGQASKEYALHNYRHQDMPSAFKRWVETMLTALGTAWEWFKTLSRGQTLQDAITDGKIDRQFIRMISDSVGLNEQARAERVQKREEENTMAEMLEDLPKLSERIKGKLLHPARATAANHPEAGELRRIYDGLTKTVKLRKKYGQQYEKNSVIKAEQFFAPRNENVNLDQLRQSLVSDGFQFDNIAEMLTAIEDSIFYGRESYATHSGLGVQNASFSLSTTSSQSIPSDLDGNATIPAVPDLPTVKASIVKAGYKINGEVYNLKNPAPQELALAAAIQLANKEKEIAARAGVFGSVLNNTKNESAFELPWVKEYQQALRQQGQQTQSSKTSQAQRLQTHVEQLFGIKTSEIIDGITLTVSSYFKQKRGKVTLDQLVYRGETSPPKIANIADSNMGDTSNISQSKYPLLRITLTNGGEFYEKIRISDHAQISTNAPRTYDYDYRANSLKQALQQTSLMEDMQAAADALWLEQKNALPDTANGAPYSPIQDRDGSLTGQESRQSLGTQDANSEQNVNTSFSLSTTSSQSIPSTLDGNATMPAMYDQLKADYEALSQQYESEPRNTIASMDKAKEIDQKIVDLLTEATDKLTESKSPPLLNSPLWSFLWTHRRMQTTTSLSHYKEKVIGELILLAKEKGWEWGLKKDSATPKYSVVTYVETPVGQISFHSATTIEALGSSVDHKKIIATTKSKLKDAFPSINWNWKELKNFGIEHFYWNNISKNSSLINKLYEQGHQDPRATLKSILLEVKTSLYPKFLGEWDEQQGQQETRLNALVKTITAPPFSDAAIPNSMVKNSGSSERVRTQDANSEQNVNTSFSLSRDSQNNLQSILEARMSRGPIERTKILETMRERLQSLVFRLENRATGDLTPMEKQLQGWRGKDLTEAQTERLRIEDAIAAVKGIVGALPAELRARVSVPLTRILDADSDLKSQNAFKELIQRADNVIEEHLQELYTERIGDLLDLARPTATEARTNKTLLTPDTQTAIAQIADIVVTSPTDLLTREASIEAQLLTLQEQIEDATDEDTARELTRQQIALQLTLGDIVTFGNLSQQSASDLAQAYETLRTIYVRGRVIRKALIDAEREKIHANRADLMHAMDKPDGVTGPEYDRATAAGEIKNKKKSFKSFALELMNVHQFLETVFPNAITVTQWSERLVKAMRGNNRRKLAAEDRYNEFMRVVLGASNNRQRGKILTAISERRVRTDILIAEVDIIKTEVIPIDYVQKILNGQMTVSYSGDKYAMTQIRQAYRDFLLQPKKKRARQENIKVQVVKSRKKPQSLFMSDLEMLDVLMTAAQESYAPTMDKHGYTEEVLEQIRNTIDPRALAIGEFLRSEYDANWSQMNPVFQRIFHMNMPNTRNYAPGTFHVAGQVKEMQNELGQAGNASAMSAGSTKNRRAHMATPKTMNALAKYFAHVEQTSYWIEYAELVKEIAQTVRNSKLLRALDVRHGEAVKTNVNQWIDRLNSDGANAANEKLTLDEGINQIMTGQSHLGLALNFSVPFKQFSAAFGSLTMEDPKEALKSFSKILFSWPEMKKIFQSEAIQQRLKQGFSPETRSLLNASKIKPSKYLDLLHMGHMPAAYADAAFSTISGFVSYDITLRRELARDGRTREQAEKIALERMDMVLAKTTQPTDTQMKSLAELRYAQGFGRLLFMFKSDPRRAVGMILATAWRYKRGDANLAELTKILGTNWVLYGLMGSIGTAIFKSLAHDESDDEDYWDWEHLILGSLLGAAGGVPIYGAVVETGLKKAFGVRQFSSTGNPLEAVFFKGVNAAFSKGEFTLKDANSIAQVLGMAGSAAGHPELVLIPAVIRALTQISNTADNLVETDTEEQARLQREHAEARKIETKKHKDNFENIVSKARATTDPAKRNEILSTLDEKTRAEARAVLAKAEQQANMTPEEIKLSKMSKAERQDAVEFVFNNLTEPDKTAYALRIKTLFDIDLIPNQE